MWRVVDISGEGRVLTLARNSLVVEVNGRETGRVPVQDIQCVLVHGYGAMISLNLGAALADAGIPLVLCGHDHQPRALMLPVSGNFEQAARLRAQADVSLPKRKKIWQDMVRAKIRAQARCLEMAGHSDHAALAKLVHLVRSGDPDNVEARAARYYWPRLMGPDFRRDADAGGLNAPLNYGYAVLRAAMARAVVGAGLSPGLGLHHRNRLNPFQLVDDLMEPFRPLVDHCVSRHSKEWSSGVSGETKSVLADIVNRGMATTTVVQPVYRVMSILCLSLAEVCAGTSRSLDWPTDWTFAVQSELDLAQ